VPLIPRTWIPAACNRLTRRIPFPPNRQVGRTGSLSAKAGAPERAGHHDHQGAARPRHHRRAPSSAVRCAGARWRRSPMGAGRVDSRWRRRSPHGTRIRRSCRCSASDLRPRFLARRPHRVLRLLARHCTIARAGLMMVAQPRPAAHGTRLSAASAALRPATAGAAGCATNQTAVRPLRQNGGFLFRYRRKAPKGSPFGSVLLHDCIVSCRGRRRQGRRPVGCALSRRPGRLLACSIAI
jgi:hypothetical protein